MKRFINFALARQPRLYESILALKGNKNLEKSVFLNLVRNGDIVFDIGANRGYYTILFSHLVGKTGKVHAFEPVPPTFKRLSDTVSREQIFNNIELNNTAVGDTNAEITIYMPSNDDGQASIETHTVGSWRSAETITSYQCNMIKLDDYADSNVVKRLDFIKCDVEGAELLVLKGGIQLISNYLPIVYLEVFADWTNSFGYTPQDIVNFLKSLGYSEFYLVDEKIKKIPESINEIDGNNLSNCANMICTVPDRHNFRTNRFKNQ